MSVPREVFVSHAHQDAAEALPIIEMLRRHGVPAWYAPHQILGAQQWHDEIGSALQRCDWLLLLLSPHSVQSRWVKFELLHALSSDAYEDHILPVMLGACDPMKLSWTLQSMQQIALTDDLADGYRKILRTWGIGYRPE